MFLYNLFLMVVLVAVVFMSARARARSHGMLSADNARARMNHFMWILISKGAAKDDPSKMRFAQKHITNGERVNSKH